MKFVKAFLTCQYICVARKPSGKFTETELLLNKFKFREFLNSYTSLFQVNCENITFLEFQLAFWSEIIKSWATNHPKNLKNKCLMNKLVFKLLPRSSNVGCSNFTFIIRQSFGAAQRKAREFFTAGFSRGQNIGRWHWYLWTDLRLVKSQSVSTFDWAVPFSPASAI